MANKKIINDSFFSIRSKVLVALFLVILVLIVFWPIFTHDFVVFDDRLNVYDNPYLKRFSLDNLFFFWAHPYQKLYIPATYSLWAVVAARSQCLFKGSIDPVCFHGSNLLLHIFNTLLVYSILRTILLQHNSTGSNLKLNYASGIGALLFALHPVQVEPIAWVTGMKDLLCGFLSLLAIKLYLHLGESSNSSVRSNKKIFLHAGITGVFILALLAKPVAVIIPLFMVIIAWGILKRSFYNIAPFILFLMVMASAITVGTIIVQTPAVVDHDYPFHLRLLVACDALIFYLYKLVWPYSLIIDYGRTPGVVTGNAKIFVQPVLLGCLFFLIYMLKAKRLWLSCAGLFIIGVLPVLGFLPFEFQSISTVADRYLYLSMLGPALALSFVVNFYDSIKLKVLSILFISAFCIVSAVQVQKWENTISITRHTLVKNPGSFMANLNLGVGLVGMGQFEDAIVYYKRALQINPGGKMVHYNMGIAYAAMNNQSAVIEQYGTLKSIDPQQADKLMHAIKRINERF